MVVLKTDPADDFVGPPIRLDVVNSGFVLDCVEVLVQQVQEVGEELLAVLLLIT